jgi:hypothetical protein
MPTFDEAVTAQCPGVAAHHEMHHHGYTYYNPKIIYGVKHKTYHFKRCKTPEEATEYAQGVLDFQRRTFAKRLAESAPLRKLHGVPENSSLTD